MPSDLSAISGACSLHRLVHGRQPVAVRAVGLTAGAPYAAPLKTRLIRHAGCMVGLADEVTSAMAATMTITICVEPADNGVEPEVLEQRLHEFAASQDWRVLSVAIRVVAILMAAA